MDLECLSVANSVRVYLLVLMYELLIRRVNFPVQQVGRKEIKWLTIILKSDCPWSLGHWQMWVALLTVCPTGRRRSILWCALFISPVFPFIPPSLFFHIPFFLWVSFSKARGLRLCRIPFGSFIFFLSIPMLSHLIIQHPTLPTCQLLPSVSF